MTQVFLVPHDFTYATRLSTLSSAPQVKTALGLSDAQTSPEGTMEFIQFILEQEKLGKQYSRVILNENKEVIGVITLKDINQINKTSHIGTWIGYAYWGKGYNQLAKAEILYTAFTKLNIKYVFAGARKTNIRSQKAQEKLPYVKIGVEQEFPEEHKKLELETNDACVLSVIEKEAFLSWYANLKNEPCWSVIFMSTEEKPIGYWLKEADQSITAKVNQHLEQYQLSRFHWQVLNTVNETNGITRTEILKLLRHFINDAELSEILQFFMAKNWMKQEEDTIHMTEAGRQAFNEILSVQQQTRMKLFEGITRAEYEITLKVLKKVVENAAR